MSEPKIRLDKWLWHARFFKTRTLAAKVVSGGHVRVNANKVSKPATTVVADPFLPFPQGTQTRVIKIVEWEPRRGPASEAQTLYEDLSPPEEKIPQEQSQRGGARPTKKDRRSLDLIRARTLD
ncbi:MAG TPA: RNA-binding protein S4 [Rhodobacteraceae bacterium]|nr:RNA-binding protein S4 [Paracoccaceae bacterium]